METYWFRDLSSVTEEKNEYVVVIIGFNLKADGAENCPRRPVKPASLGLSSCQHVMFTIYVSVFKLT